MDREDGFPPHIVGFMRRKREKEKLMNGQPSQRTTRDFEASNDDGGRASPNA